MKKFFICISMLFSLCSIGFAGNSVPLNHQPIGNSHDEIWKIGQTTKGLHRYSKKSYENSNFNMEPIFWGNTTELLIYEKIHIYKYFIKNGHLPPGNYIFR